MELSDLGSRQLHNIFNAATLVSIISTDSDGLITIFNSGAERMLGYKAEEMVGKHTPAKIHLESEIISRGQELTNEMDRPVGGFEVCVLKAVLDGYEEREWTYIRKDGVHIQVNLGVTTIRDDRGEIVGFLGIGTDITKRKRAEIELAKSEERYHFFLDNVEEGVLLTENEKIIDVSDGWLAMLRCDREYALGRSPLEFVASDDKEHVIKQIQAKHSEPYEAELLRKDGTTFPAQVRGRMLRFGGSKVRLATVHDISRHKENEAALKAAKAEAEKANQAKSKFLSSMSHELRTPLNAILGFSQMMALNPDEPLTETQETCIDHITNGGEHLLQLVNQVLDLTKIEVGKMDISIEDINTRTILNECLSLIETIANSHHIEIVIGDGFQMVPWVRADQTRLKQSLLNLLSNAIKYNSKNGKLTLDCQETSHSALRISIADTGVGIPADQLNELFEPFNRLKAEGSKIEGTGIGLTITKQLIEMMGGQIGVQSEVGKGTTFWIDLPLSTESNTSEHTTKKQIRKKSRPIQLPNLSGKMLYVEDNPANLKLMEMIVRRIDSLTMVSAESAESGIEYAKDNPLDLIILDINLPGMDGFEALKKLQEIENTKNIPTIAMSANVMPEDIRKGLEAGFMDYISKPIEVDEVMGTIKEIMEK
ncbi:MAG: PAS domain S-box protein [Rhodospirillales bacterium]|nr:PAS domain S-box protein [Rhodospirillales bacterium]